MGLIGFTLHSTVLITGTGRSFGKCSFGEKVRMRAKAAGTFRTMASHERESEQFEDTLLVLNGVASDL